MGIKKNIFTCQQVHVGVICYGKPKSTHYLLDTGAPPQKKKKASGKDFNAELRAPPAPWYPLGSVMDLGIQLWRQLQFHLQRSHSKISVDASQTPDWTPVSSRDSAGIIKLQLMIGKFQPITWIDKRTP